MAGEIDPAAVNHLIKEVRLEKVLL